MIELAAKKWAVRLQDTIRQLQVIFIQISDPLPPSPHPTPQPSELTNIFSMINVRLDPPVQLLQYQVRSFEIKSKFAPVDEEIRRQFEAVTSCPVMYLLKACPEP
jgi:hypothetical protein